MDQKPSKSEFGVGKPVRRKEDERFLRGRGEYVGDIRLDNMHEVAFVRSPVAHARLTRVDVPPEYCDAVFTWDDSIGVNPIVWAPPEKSYKRSQQPILATGKLRYVGELVAMCVARTRAEAEDIPQSVTLELEGLPAGVDMIDACKPGSPLVHEEWANNTVVEFTRDGPIGDVARAAAIKVGKHISTSPHSLSPCEGRGVIAYQDERLRYLTVISSTQFPHCVQTGLCEALGIPDGDVRVVSPDVGGGFGYKGLLNVEEVGLAGFARRAR